MNLLNIFLLLSVIQVSYGQNLETNNILDIFPESTIHVLPSTNHYQSEYIVHIKQYIDHSHPQLGSFSQRIFLSHYDFNAPTVVKISGYAAQYDMTEISDILQSNQIIIEHRYYGKSKITDSIPYNYLSNDQAAQDVHFIINQVKKLYRGKFLSTGISKGGTSCLIHKALFPEDVDATVVFSTPMITSMNDSRVDTFMNEVGSAKIREKIFQFQKESIFNLDSIQNLMKIDYTDCGYERIGGVYNALQCAILDFPYIYWQMGHSSAVLNGPKSPNDYYEILKAVVDLAKYCDEQIKKDELAYYQFFTENGFYTYSDSIKKQLDITSLRNNRNVFLPKNIEATYDKDYIRNIITKLNNKGNKIISIYSDKDPWYATYWKPNSLLNSILIVDENVTHNINIKDLSDLKQELILFKIKKWME